jgi:hypothetical protein
MGQIDTRKIDTCLIDFELFPADGIDYHAQLRTFYQSDMIGTFGSFLATRVASEVLSSAAMLAHMEINFRRALIPISAGHASIR